MSTQQSGSPSIPFSISHDQQKFRLLELPPELVELIEKDRSEGRGHGRFQLKSATSSTSHSHSHDTNITTKSTNSTPSSTTSSSQYLHLCTTTKVYTVKQVNTSNSVFILRPSPSHHSPINDPSNEMDLDGPSSESTTIPKTSVTAISKIGNILELIPFKPDPGDVERSIRRIVPVFVDDDDDDDDENGDVITKGVSREEIYQNIPAPDTMIKQIADELFVFGIDHSRSSDTSRMADEGKMCFRPSFTLLLRSWKGLVQTSTIAGIKLDGDLDLETIFKAMVESDKDDDRSKENMLCYAVVKAILQNSHLCGVQEMSTSESKPPSSAARFNPLTASLLFGRLLLLSHFWHPDELADVGNSTPYTQPDDTPDKTICVREFQNEWSAILPESWSVYCNTVDVLTPQSSEAVLSTPNLSFEIVKDPAGTDEIIKVSASNANADTAKNVIMKDTEIMKGSLSTPVPGSATAPNKRKWHEKFAAQRHAKRG